MMQKPKAVNEYINMFPIGMQLQLETIRTIIKNAAPDAEETMSYGMPAYKQQKIIVYFSGNKNHIGFYPTASGIENFKDQLTNFKWSKGAIQFPMDQPLPKKLITAIVKFRVKEVEQKAKKKK